MDFQPVEQTSQELARMVQEPKTDAERAFYSALLVLLNKRDMVAISTERFLILCRAVPQYALRMIEANRTSLMYTVGRQRSPIAEMIMTAEMELKGISLFIKDHNLAAETEYVHFIEQQLKAYPEQFSSADLELLIRTFRKEGQSIRETALDALAKYVTTFADRLAAEPPGLSEDIESLKRSIGTFGFGPDLNDVLTKIDDDVHKSKDGFDQAATMKHIRSFFEKLHERIAKELQLRKPLTRDDTPLNQCGNAIDYLARKNVITGKIQSLGRCLYAILSDGEYGVHALKATRDYTRLCRNMVVEYAITLFFEFDRRLSESDEE
jgi:hypothetical protein